LGVGNNRFFATVPNAEPNNPSSSHCKLDAIQYWFDIYFLSNVGLKKTDTPKVIHGRNKPLHAYGFMPCFGQCIFIKRTEIIPVYDFPFSVFIPRQFDLYRLFHGGYNSFNPNTFFIDT
jgi:hypothetical protein